MADVMPDFDLELENSEESGMLDKVTLDASLAQAKIRFSSQTEQAPPALRPPDLASTPPLAPVVSEQAKEIQQLKAALHDAERTAMRAQKAAQDYREQLTEAQADIAAMKSRWYAAEKARNAVSSQREVDSSAINGQLLRAQKELERTQQLARTDMERAAGRIHVLEERLEKAQTIAAQAESSQNQYKKRSNFVLSAAISVALVASAIAAYAYLPHSSNTSEPGTVEAAGVSRGGGPVGIPRGGMPSRPVPSISVESISQKPFVPRSVTKSLPDAMARLDRALKGFPGLDQEEILHQVQKRQSIPGRPVCAFSFANGQPAITFSKDTKGGTAETWAQDISRCADAVEQAH